MKNNYTEEMAKIQEALNLKKHSLEHDYRMRQQSEKLAKLLEQSNET